MKRLKLYLETSVWNFLFADDAPEKKSATDLLFRAIEREQFTLFISEIVMNEINRAPFDKQDALSVAIRKHAPILLYDSTESQDLVDHYLKNGLLSRNQLDDLSHVAIASIHDMDILVSWNLRHIVKQKTRAMVNALNHLMGYHDLDICTPEEVLDYDLSE